MLGTHGVAFGKTLGTTHSGYTHTATILVITLMRHIDHIHMRLITLIILIHHITLTTLAQIIIMVQTIIIMVLPMLIAEIMTVAEATQEAMLHALHQATEIQMATLHVQQTTQKEMQT